ncbi:DUF3330 domain-containing protein [Rhodoferax sp. UBA5149]|uniref:DUF3330 domain-containing protein n=1 Tax=Rhodoferax sp. UBA5149 TaxID=1947379 RepID=UPI0025CC14A7|nr:DUF3330 domain-containing protein [Rhodoferax sp. UBA5149]
MTTHDKPVDVERVACEICLKEVPLSEATVPEATDYFVHFCGLACYEKWRDQRAKPDDQVEKSGS